jgi:HKD family nuclease
MLPIINKLNEHSDIDISVTVSFLKEDGIEML